MTANLTLSAGRPGFDWEAVLLDVLKNGTFQPDIAPTATLVLDAGAGVTLTLTGSNLTTDSGGGLTAGTISEVTLTSADGTLDITFSSELLTAGAVNAMITASATVTDPYGQDFKDALSPIAILENVISVGSNDDDSLYGTAFGGDQLSGGDGNDFFLINTDPGFGSAAETINGGSGFDFVAMRTNFNHGIEIDFDSGTIRDQNDNHLIAEITDIEGAIGTSHDDHFIGLHSDDANHYWAGSAGNDQYDGNGTGRGYIRLSYANIEGDTGGAIDGGITVDFNSGTVLKFNSSNVLIGTDHFWGINTVMGTTHDDTFIGDVWDNDFQGLGGNDTFTGGGGNDRVSYQDDDQYGGTDGVIVNLSDSTVSGVAAGHARDGFHGIDTLNDISSATGTQHDDLLVGNSDHNEFEGNQGNDTLIGGDGDDGLNGGSGNDSIDAGDGDDYIRGGVATNLTLGDGDQVDGGSGNDRLDFYSTDGGHSGVDTLAFNLTGGGGDVTGTYFDDNSNSPGSVNTHFTGVDTFDGSIGDDTFTVQADFVADDDGRDWRTFNDFRDPNGTVLFIGGRGNDTFTDNGTTADPYGVAVLGYSDEYWHENERGFGVFVNLSSTDKSYAGYDHDNSEVGADPDTGSNNADDTVGSGHAIDTFGDTDTIVGVTLFDLSHKDDVFFGRETGDNGEYVQGNEGNDYIVGGGAADSLHGDQNDDTLYGGDGGDDLDGGDDDDELHGDGGGDHLGGGQGDDVIFGDAGRDNINGDDGNDTMSGGTDMDRLWGGQGDDLLHGNDGVDQLEGDDGNDVEFGDAGNDSVNGGNNDDTVLGGAGNDRIRGDNGNDVLSGDDDDFSGPHTGALQTGATGTGADSLDGGQGNDLLYGGGGNDQLDGGQDNDTLWGGLGNDRVHGQEGTDVLHGGDGDDQLNGDDGNDSLFGDAGNDNLFGGDDAGNDTLDGGTGNDHVDGGDGNDSLIGGTGADQLGGGNGNDTLVASDGLDKFYGDAGNDTYVLGAFAVVDIWDQSGIDTVTTSVARNLSTPGMAWDTIENLTMVAGGTGALTGNGLNNTLDGSLAVSANALAGLGGNDTYIVGAGDTVNETVAGSSGTDLVKSSVSFTLGTNVENLTITVNTNGINGTGNTGNNVIVGGGGTNNLNGAAGNDNLNGGAGNDTLVGGAGNDTLTGGANSDFFLFNTTPNASTNVDTITDFNAAADTIQLDNAVMAALGTTLGTLAATKFWASTTGLAHDADDRITYETDTGKLFYDSNGNGAGGAVQIAVLTGHPTITNADFVIV